MAKYLIRSDFKAIRKGEHVSANGKAGEFVYETGNGANLSLAQILEIAAANKLTISKSAKKSEAAAKLDELLETLKLDEVNKMTDTAVVEKICDAGVAVGKTDDEMLIEIVSAGVKFAQAGKLFRHVMETKGYRMSSKGRLAQADTLLADVELSTADDVAAAIETLSKSIPDTNEKQATAILRKFAKANEIELPKVEKSAKKGAKGSFRTKVFKWMVANPAAETAELVTFITDLGKKENVAKRFVDIFEFAKQFAAAQK